MDYLKDLNSLALGSRLKRLSDYLMKEVSQIYKSNNIDFEPKFMPIINLLNKKGELSINEISYDLGVTQPAVTQFCNSLYKKGLITFKKDKTDERKKLVSLSKKGKNLIPHLEPIWEIITSEINNLFLELNIDFLQNIENLESSFSNKSLHERVNNNMNTKLVEIIDYLDEYKDSFKNLNMEWIEKYFEPEEKDIQVLSDPENEIIKKNGKVIFAKYNGEIAGTVALLACDNNEYELAKMAVSPKFQGKKIGNKLMEGALKKAKEINAYKVFLVSNTKLIPALNLYKKYGFIEVPLENSEYKRCDIKMEILIN